jgi:endonuclease YncB( thermonuclease family)
MQPPLGLTARCKVIEVYDGDTVTVEVRTIARVRLLDCWAPEVRTRDDAEKLRGFAARDHLAKAIEGRHAVLHIPSSSEIERLDGLLTFGRVLGSLYIDGQDVAEMMVAAGHATATKGT